MDWITDRLPTKADADEWGDVVIGYEGGWDMVRWEEVQTGQAWLAFKPADAADFLNSIAAAVEAGQRRRIISTNRTVHPNGVGIIDAVADDGTAWWIAQGDDDNGWRQLPPLPDREPQP
jgi:hypothetical protein